jgi:hypothetical protein
MDARWVSMQMHLSLMMPNPGHATLATFPQFSLAALWAGLERFGGEETLKIGILIQSELK